MKILLIAEPYLGLYKEIKEEFERQGHHVTYYEEPKRGISVFQKRNYSLIRTIKRIYVEKISYFEKFWQQRIAEEHILNEQYDLLFVINGMSYSNVLLEHLRKINPRIKSSLYIWDSNLTFDYFRNIDFFDKVYSFDYYDVINFGQGKVQFLPFYWSKNLMSNDNAEICYDIFSIGSLHDDRLFVYKEVIKQMELERRRYFIKLYVKTKEEGAFARLFSSMRLKKYDEKTRDAYLVKTGKRTYPFVTHEFYTPEDMAKLMSQSKAVLDTDLEKQGGTTPRLIWALACNKHIFTTNKKIVDLPIYNPNAIHIIDRKKPIVDTSILNEKQPDSRKSVEFLRIDNWIKNFL